MIGPVGFATRNLRRRGFHSFLAFVGLTVTVTSTSFLLLVGQSLTSKLNVEFDTKSTLGISYLFLGYIMIALVFILVVGAVSAGYLVSAMISQRTHDIGVVKAAGCRTPLLFAYALTEALLVFLASTLVGAIFSVILYATWTGTFLLDQLTTTTVLGTSILSFGLSYIIARFQVWRIIKSTAANAITSQLSSLDLRNVGKPLRVKRLGLTFNMASRTILRNRRFGRTVTSISFCIFLSSIVLTGALVSWDTSKSYVELAMPKHVLVMGTPQMVDQYTRMGQSFSTSTLIPQVNGFNVSNIFSSQVVNMTRALPGVIRVDSRMMNVTTVEGFSGTQTIEDQNGNTMIIPPVYLGREQVAFFGVDPNQTIGDWHSSDGFLSTTDSQNTVVVGDSLVGGIVGQPLNGSEIRAFNGGATFFVKGAIVDPLNRGRVVYAALGRVHALLGQDGYNLLLVRTDGSQTAIQSVQQLAKASGLVVAAQDTILGMNTSFLDGMWMRIIILPFLTLLLTGAILISYLSTNFSARFNDYAAIRVLGSRGPYILKLLLWEGGGVALFCALLALPLSLLFSELFFVPNATVSTPDLALSTALSLAVLGVVSIGSTVIYWRKLSRVTVKDLVT